MKVELSLNPNCSEAVIRINTKRLSEEDKKKLFAELTKAVEKYDYDTGVYENEIFGVEMIEVKGDMPYNSPKKLEVIINRYKDLKPEDIESEGE